MPNFLIKMSENNGLTTIKVNSSDVAWLKDNVAAATDAERFFKLCRYYRENYGITNFEYLIKKYKIK